MEDQDIYCEKCGKPLQQEKVSVPHPVPHSSPNYLPPPPPPESPPPKTAESSPVRYKSPGLAALASFLSAGLGQVYNGNFLRGLGIFFGTLIGSFAFIIPGLIVFVFGIYDAYRTAQRMNAGEIPFREYNWLHIILFFVIVVVVIIIVYMMILALMISLEELLATEPEWNY